MPTRLRTYTPTYLYTYKPTHLRTDMPTHLSIEDQVINRRNPKPVIIKWPPAMLRYVGVF